MQKNICDHDVLIDINFTKSFLKHIQGKEIAISDLEEIDAHLGKNLKWILENNIENLELNFTYEFEILGERITIELEEGGYDKIVTEENKKDYVKKVCEARMSKEIEKPIHAFLKGFKTILPKHCLSHLGISDLEIIIAGSPEIDLKDMKDNTNFHGFSNSGNIIKWFWEIMEEFTQEQLAAFLYFLSGSVKAPFGGFKERHFIITKVSNKESLPVAHTCNYELEIPEYESKEKLREKLLMVIFEGAESFHIS